MSKFDDEYYGYYDMYAVEEITINKFLTRDIVINIIKNSSDFDRIKFLQTFNLNNKEKIDWYLMGLKEQNLTLLKFLLFYQFGFHDIFKEDNENNIKRLKLKIGKENDEVNYGQKKKEE